MIRAIALPVMFLTSAMIALAADQSSNSDEPGEFDVEPPILKQNLSDELAEAGTPDGDVARCEKKTGACETKCGRRGTPVEDWRTRESRGRATSVEDGQVRN